MSFPHGVISVFLYFCLYVHVLLLAFVRCGGSYTSTPVVSYLSTTLGKWNKF